MEDSTLVSSFSSNLLSVRLVLPAFVLCLPRSVVPSLSPSFPPCFGPLVIIGGWECFFSGVGFVVRGSSE